MSVTNKNGGCKKEVENCMAQGKKVGDVIIYKSERKREVQV